jgi:peptide/nickel transport system permease protein
VTSATPHAVPTAGSVVDFVSYWSLVGVQLRKRRIAMTAWYLLLLVIVTAVAAPLIAMNEPIVVAGGGEGLTFPLFQDLFDRFLYANGVDVFFNLILVLGPLWLGAHLVVTGLRRVRVLGARFGPVARVVTGALMGGGWAALLLLAALTGARSIGWLLATAGLGGVGAVVAARWPTRAPTRRGLRLGRLVWAVAFLASFGALMGPGRSTKSLTDWNARTKELAATGAFVLRPPIPHHFDNLGESSEAAARSLRRPGPENVLGCDLAGRDVAARLVFGTRISMTIGIVAVSIYIAIGILLGGLAGFYRGKVDLAISRLIEIMICFPTLFLILTMIAVLESRSIFMIMFVIGIVGWPNVARLVRGEFLRQASLDYVTAAHAQGVPERRIIFGHVLPNCMGPVLVSATFGIAGAILTESSLAFLGLGDTTAPSWGQLLNSGRSEGQFHLIFAPGFAIFFVIFVFNLLAEGLRDALDPKLRR